MMLNNTVSRLPDQVAVRVDDNLVHLSQNGGCFSNENFNVNIEDMNVLVTANIGISYVILRWKEDFPAGTVFMCDAFERTYGDSEWRFMVPERVMPWYFLASAEGQTAGYGVKVRPNALAFWQADSGGITLWLDLRCGSEPVELNGNTINAATIVEAFSRKNENQFEFHKVLCKKMCSDGLTVKNPVYGGNNWYYAYGNSSHSEILRDSELLSSLTYGLENRPYMVIDDCWQEFSPEYAAAGGPYTRGNQKFPDMKRLAGEMRERNVKPGIWIRPTLTHDNSISDEWRLERDRDILDVTVPEVLRHIGNEVNNITGNWGFELVKYDFVIYDIFGKYAFEMPFSLTDEKWSFKDKSKTTAQAIKMLFKTILDNSNDAVLIGCNCIGHLGAGYFHVHRSGDDTSGQNWERTRKMGINSLAFRLPQHNVFFAVDADCVGITPDVPWELNREWLRLVANSGTPLFCSIKPSSITDKQREEIVSAFRINSIQKDIAEPLDWLYNSCPAKWLINGTETNFSFTKEIGIPNI